MKSIVHGLLPASALSFGLLVVRIGQHFVRRSTGLVLVPILPSSVSWFALVLIVRFLRSWLMLRMFLAGQLSLSLAETGPPNIGGDIGQFQWCGQTQGMCLFGGINLRGAG
jgi:hypothetical protein